MQSSPKVTIRRFGIIDLVIIVVIAASAVAFIPLMHEALPATAIVRRDNTVIARYPLDRDCSFRIRGAAGMLDIRIDGKTVRVTHATCRNQVCVHTGPIRRPFQQIICAPNHVVIEIATPHAADTIDAIAR